MKAAFIIILGIAIFSCNKKSESADPIKPEDRAKAAALTEFLKNDQFRLKKYYSEVPIDYVDTDQVVKSETDLWNYVSSWLKDDSYTFKANGEVDIEQNDIKISSDSSALILRHYSVTPDENGVAFNFVGHEYQDLSYRLVNFSDTALVVSAIWNGNKVISEYKVLP